MQSGGAAAVLDDAHMVAHESARMSGAAGVGDQAGAVANFADEILHPHCLVGWVEAALQPGIMGGDAGRAGVLVAFERLDAAKRKHEATGRDDEIGAGAIGPGHFSRSDQLA